MQRRAPMDEWHRSGGSPPLLFGDGRTWRIPSDGCASRGVSNRRLARKLESGARGAHTRRGQPENDQAALLRRAGHNPKKSGSESQRESHRQLPALCAIEGCPYLTPSLTARLPFYISNNISTG